MRISDWSSDVCSSDLIRFKLDGRSVKLDTRVHAARGDLADLALAGVLFSAHYARAVELTCVAAGAPLLASDTPKARAVRELLRGESFHALDVTAEIGRASCRERVCQYV